MFPGSEFALPGRSVRQAHLIRTAHTIRESLLRQASKRWQRAALEVWISCKLTIFAVSVFRGRKKHINFFNINFMAPTQNPPFWAPRKKFMSHFLGKNAKEAHKHKLFRGNLGVKKGVPNRPFSATKSLVYCFFPALSFSGTKKEPKPKLLSPDIFWWGGGLPRERVGAKKFGMSLETQGIKLFWWDIPGFCRGIPEAPEKFEKKMFGFNFWPLVFGFLVRSGKSQNESFPNFSNFRPEFCPEFCSEFSPNFSRTFCASFRGRRRPEKFTKNPRHFSMQNSQANTKKIFTKFFWRAGKVTLGA